MSYLFFYLDEFPTKLDLEFDKLCENMFDFWVSFLQFDQLDVVLFENSQNISIKRHECFYELMESDLLSKLMMIEEVPNFILTKLNVDLVQVILPVSLGLHLLPQRYP